MGFFFIRNILRGQIKRCGLARAQEQDNPDRDVVHRLLYLAELGRKKKPNKNLDTRDAFLLLG